MKKCPFCHADIEDNARFCVFCMSSLQEKEKIENQPKNNQRWLYILSTFLLLVLIFIITIFALSKNEVNNSSEASIQSEITSKKLFSNQSDILSSETISNNTHTDNSSQDSALNNSSNTTTNYYNSTIVTQSANDSQSNTNSNSSNSTATSQLQPVQNDNNDTQTSEEDINQETITNTEAKYLYRDAVATDCYTEGNIPAQPIENVIVITGVACAANDGIYTIPEEIDGKRVGAIMPYAFSDTAISGTVKKVIVPTSVKTIWQNAFSSCYNLTDIYLYGKTIDIYETAFADVSNRTETLTIHCSRDCKTFNFYYYRNIAKNYDANYQEWNGGEIE